MYIWYPIWALHFATNVVSSFGSENGEDRSQLLPLKFVPVQMQGVLNAQAKSQTSPTPSLLLSSCPTLLTKGQFSAKSGTPSSSSSPMSENSPTHQLHPTRRRTVFSTGSAGPALQVFTELCPYYVRCTECTGHCQKQLRFCIL